MTEHNTFIHEVVADSFSSTPCIFQTPIVSLIVRDCIPYNERIFNRKPRVSFIQQSVFIHTHASVTGMWSVVPLYEVAASCVAWQTNSLSAMIYNFCTKQTSTLFGGSQKSVTLSNLNLLSSNPECDTGQS